MLERRLSIGAFLCGALGLVVSSTLGVSYSSRHSSHEGFHRVPVVDSLGAVPGFRRPRRTVVVVFDGLGYVDAVTMPSFGRIAERGQCWRTDVGELSISRPVYAVLSTGLEQDRTGVRGNDDASPLAAESIWEIARASGMTVSAVSELPWWRELFPRGFDVYEMPAREENYFARIPPADLELVHPVYVDETAHAHGAACRAYDECVDRADRELGGLLDALDLAQDLVIVTADHGHSLRGGHGGPQDRVSHVLTCYAGLGILPRAEEGALRATAVGPSIALLLGLRFPSSMRAGEDDLDALFEIADPTAFPPGYLDERRSTILRFRAENEAQLRRWLPSSDGSWSRFRAHERHVQLLRALPCALLLVLVLVLQARFHRSRGHGPRAAVFGASFVVAFGLGLYALQIALRGSFDLTSVTVGSELIGFTLALALSWSFLAMGVHTVVRGDLAALVVDFSAVSACATVLGLAHPAALGLHVGYPAPSADVYFFPYFAAIAFAVVHTALLGLVSAAALDARRRARRSTGAPGKPGRSFDQRYVKRSS
jgi:hypothetical protein